MLNIQLPHEKEHLTIFEIDNDFQIEININRKECYILNVEQTYEIIEFLQKQLKGLKK